MQDVLDLIINPKIDQVIGKEFADQKLHGDKIQLLFPLTGFGHRKQIVGHFEQNLVDLPVGTTRQRFAADLLCSLLQLLFQIRNQDISLQIGMCWHNNSFLYDATFSATSLFYSSKDRFST